MIILQYPNYVYRLIQAKARLPIYLQRSIICWAKGGTGESSGARPEGVNVEKQVESQYKINEMVISAKVRGT